MVNYAGWYATVQFSPCIRGELEGGVCSAWINGFFQDHVKMSVDSTHEDTKFLRNQTNSLSDFES